MPIRFFFFFGIIIEIILFVLVAVGLLFYFNGCCANSPN